MPLSLRVSIERIFNSIFFGLTGIMYIIILYVESQWALEAAVVKNAEETAVLAYWCLTSSDLLILKRLQVLKQSCRLTCL